MQQPRPDRQHTSLRLRVGASSPRIATDARLRRPSSLPQRALLGRALRGAGLVGLAGLAAVGVVQIAGWIERSDALPVRTVAVHGVEGARMDEVLAYAGVEPGAPLFAVDTAEVAARVLEHPFVASVSVRRVPPDGIEIRVEPRAPRAVMAADALYLVDAHGQVMKTARPGDGLDLPLITGVDVAALDPVGAPGADTGTLAAAVALIDAHDEAGSPGGALSEVNVIAGVGFELVLESPAGALTRVRVGDADLAQKLVRLDVIFDRLAAAGRTASFIYLDDGRRPERAAVRLRPLAETPVAGGIETTSRERG